MSIWRLIRREIRFRKLNAFLAWASVTLAVGCLVGALSLLKADRIHTERVLAAKQAEVEQAGASLEDAMRRITKGLGFNILILPEDQDLGELHLEGALSRTMPEEYVDRLANSRIVTVNHLLPSVVKKLVWPEQELPVVLQGTRGEVPLAHSDPKKPLLEAVPRGEMVLGYRLQQHLQASPGDRVVFFGREYTIRRTHAERGTRDDHTVWIHLQEAQELLEMENLIHAILALECHCAGDRLAAIRTEIEGILPGTRVIERGPPALARAEARTRAKEAALEALEVETSHRSRVLRQHERFAAILVPLVLVGCSLWIGVLTFNNVRERRTEIGVLRALGFRSPRILGMFLGKAVTIGLAGASVGVLGGLALGAAFGGLSVKATFSLGTASAGGIVALLVSLLGGWIPAVHAARQDPAFVLQQD